MKSAERINRRAALGRLLRYGAPWALALSNPALASPALDNALHVPDRLPHGIHVGLTADPYTSIVLGWYTLDALVGPCEVEVGVLGEQSHWLEAGRTTTHPSLGNSHYHEVLIDSLQPGTEYEILPRPGSPDEHSVVARTFDSWDDSLVVTVYADHGLKPTSVQVMERTASIDADFHLHLGDLSYANGNPSIWDRWLDLIEPLATDRPYLTVFGNHEIEARWLDAGYLNRFAMPDHELYYSLRHDRLTLIVLDSEALVEGRGAEQREWAIGELEAANADPRVSWIVVALHRPLYSSSYHGGDPELVRCVEPLLLEYGVDLVLSGHDHLYERSFPVAEGQVRSSELSFYENPSAPIHVVSGGGGESLYSPGWSDFTAVTERAFHLLRLEFQGAERLLVEAIRPNGTRIDSFEIAKTALAPTRPDSNH